MKVELTPEQTLKYFTRKQLIEEILKLKEEVKLLRNGGRYCAGCLNQKNHVHPLS